MRNLRQITISIVLGGVLLLSACGTSDKASSSNSSDSAVTSQTAVSTTIETSEANGLLSIGEGTQKMKHIIKKIEEGLEGKKSDEVVKEASELDEVWEKFEDTVKEKSKDLYDKAEKPLGTLKAGVKVKPLDEKTLKNAIEDLDGVLKDIEALEPTANSDKKPISIQDGVKEMKEFAMEAKGQLAEKNKDKLINEVNELDEVWESFEDTVKEKSKDLYDKTESPLGVIKAGVKIEPLDDKTLNSALDNLIKILDDIEKLK